MNLKDFIAEFDRENSVVLLEGKRVVAAQDVQKLVQLGELLASRTKYMQFRSGNAEGADEHFSSGVASVNASRLEHIIPYTGHRKKAIRAYRSHSLEEINLKDAPDVVYQSKSNKKTESLIDRYVAGSRDRFTIKAAYILHDTVKVLGAGDIKPASFGIFYDDLDDPRSGGTGHTMNVCTINGIPCIDQSIWFPWLKQ